MKKILIVDDDESNLYYLQSLFSSQGFNVLAARNGFEALELARREPPDLIISDILMPVMDGFKLCREWKKDDLLKKIPFVMYTATYTDPKDEKLALSLGADRFIIKPQEPDVLLALIQDIIVSNASYHEIVGIGVEGTAPWEIVLEKYNEALFRKLGDKINQLENLNQTLRESEEKYRSVFDNSIEGIYQTTREGQFLNANAAFYRMLGYQSFDELKARVADIPKQLYVNPEDRDKIIRLLDNKEIVRGFETRFYTKNGDTIWVNINMQAVCDKNGDLLYYEGIDEDITIKKQAEEKLSHTLETLRGSFNATTQIIASAVEMRDPFISGHQRRVTNLAQAIAKQMDIPDDIINGIVTVGLIHDIGKISIPAEILSKPGKLSTVEFSFIRTHSQMGYNILKDIEYPWPVADIVLQHHERLDGSGYPNGLKGDDILLETRVIMVADVVEAMVSHRPYRPALGINAAIEEIEKNKGTLYDKTVVDACTKLLRDQGFQLK
jgi:PAS domain S-box-containing protein